MEDIGYHTGSDLVRDGVIGLHRRRGIGVAQHPGARALPSDQLFPLGKKDAHP
jgi:hypothetical protein